MNSDDLYLFWRWCNSWATCTFFLYLLLNNHRKLSDPVYVPFYKTTNMDYY